MSELNVPIEKVETSDFTIKYFKFGKGSRTFVILPGLSIQSVMDSAALVADAYSSMEDDFTVYVFDRRSELPQKYSVYDMARDTGAAMEALGLRDICLFGASQGGMMALVIAIEYPGLVHRLALGSAAAKISGPRRQVIEEWIETAKRKDAAGLYLDFGEKLYPPEVFSQYRNALIQAGEAVSDEDLERFIVLAEGTRDFDVSDKLESIHCPVLTISAADDRVLGSDAASEIIGHLGSRPDFESHIYDGYGHAAFDTAPDYKERLLRFFLK